MKLFDFHLHPGYDFHDEELGYHITPELFVQGLKKCGVDFCAGSVIHKADANRPLAEYAEILPRLNREAYEFYERYPAFYTPGLHVHPECAELSCRELEYYAKRGVRLVGELVPYQMGWRDFSDKRLWEILEVAQSFDMVLNFHPNKRPADMEALVKQFPRLQIVIAHLDGYGLYDFAIEVMRKYDNVYFDISAHGATREGMLRDAVDRVGAQRILYGTDYPGYSPTPFINAVLQAGLTEAEQEYIFCKNACRLLGVTPD